MTLWNPSQGLLGGVFEIANSGAQFHAMRFENLASQSQAAERRPERFPALSHARPSRESRWLSR